MKQHNIQHCIHQYLPITYALKTVWLKWNKKRKEKKTNSYPPPSVS